MVATPPPTTRAAYECSPLKDDDVVRSRPRRHSLPEARRPTPVTTSRPRRHTLPAIVAPPCPLPAPSCPPAKTGALPPVKPLSSKVQVPRKQFMMLKAVFEEHDATKDGYLTLEDFVAAVTAADAKKAKSEGERRGALCFDETTREVVGRKAEQSFLEGAHARRQHATGMFKAIVSKKSRSSCEQTVEHISLLDFLALYLPHLSKAALKKAHDKYVKAPAPKRKPTLEDVDGAKEEVEQIFRSLGPNHQGLVSMRTLEPRLEKLGFNSQDVSDLLAELPPPLFRAQGDVNAPEQAQLQRQKSMLSLQDVEKLLEPVFCVHNSPKDGLISHSEMEKQIAASSEMAMGLIYSC